ncbi:hypothetical protein ACG83_00030 [Frankia sp. R43]|uniref:hypothetical protein n=1 Tax=Frankia sp. R43 TaxID=269536 RepID=UPI0006CA5700|nr:hypothetical protein [Frankia sp. R43]KPM56401.1 hypothetical protein ACG83_00030 [Frankia sp. R43]
MNDDLIFLLLLVGFTLAIGVWMFTADRREDPPGEHGERTRTEQRTQAQIDALRASRRIGTAFWRGTRAMHDAARDERRDEGRQ